MFSLYKTVFIYSGYVFIAILAGFLLSISVPEGKICRQITGFSMEFASGFTVSIIFLYLIPSAYAFCKLPELLLFLILGISTAMLMQERLKYRHRKMSEKNRIAATEKLSALSFAISSFIRGISVGTGFGLSAGLAFGLGSASALDTFPESSAIFMMSKTSGKPLRKRILCCFCLAIPFLLGSLCGANIGVADRSWLIRMLAFSGGITMYSAVGDVSIESKLLYRGRYIPIFNISGMIFGIATVLSG